MLKFVAIRLILIYQKYISPYKGFHCAHRRFHGGRSCSQYTLVAIRRFGIKAIWTLMPKRLDHCKMTHHSFKVISSNQDENPTQPKKEKFDCDDCGCDSSDCSCDDLLPINCSNDFDCGCDDCSCDGIFFSPIHQLHHLIELKRASRRSKK